VERGLISRKNGLFWKIIVACPIWTVHAPDPTAAEIGRRGHSLRPSFGGRIHCEEIPCNDLMLIKASRSLGRATLLHACGLYSLSEGIIGPALLHASEISTSCTLKLDRKNRWKEIQFLNHDLLVVAFYVPRVMNIKIQGAIQSSGKKHNRSVTDKQTRGTYRLW
jgi:hypothetical protein